MAILILKIRSMARANTDWERLPLEIRDIIISEVLKSSIPTPGANRDSFAAYVQILINLSTLSRTFRTTEFARGLARIINQLVHQYITVLKTVCRVQRAIVVEKANLDAASSDQQWLIIAGRGNHIVTILKDDLLPLVNHIGKCLKYSGRVLKNSAKTTQVSLILKWPDLREEPEYR